VTLAALAVALLAPSTAWAATEQASSGDVSATLTYAKGGTPPEQLTITRAGQTMFSGRVSASSCGGDCVPFAAVDARDPPLVVADLEGDGSPDVVIYLYTGGAHCCTVTVIYREDPGTSTYVPFAHDWGDPVPRVEPLGGAPAFVSADDGFAYSFDSFAFSGLPLEILRLHGTSFTDVTGQFPAPLRADAAMQYRSYLQNRRQREGLGFIAAWTADEYRLDRRPQALATLRSLARRHLLRGDPVTGTPSGTRFIRRLEAFLHQLGYR
jgi:hypothetical protein